MTEKEQKVFDLAQKLSDFDPADVFGSPTKVLAALKETGGDTAKFNKFISIFLDLSLACTLAITKEAHETDRVQGDGPDSPQAT